MLNPIKKTYDIKNNCVLDMIMLYEFTNIIILKVLGGIIYSLYGSYICLSYLHLHQGNISKKYESFKYTTFDDRSGIFIVYVSMSIIYCHGFSRVKFYNVIFHAIATLLLITLKKVSRL